MIIKGNPELYYGMKFLIYVSVTLLPNNFD